jgi:hypothetical protein
MIYFKDHMMSITASPSFTQVKALKREMDVPTVSRFDAEFATPFAPSFTQIEALKREMDAHYAPQLARVLLEVSDLRAEVRTGRARERALLLYGLLAMLLLVAGLLGRQVGVATCVLCL